MASTQAQTANASSLRPIVLPTKSFPFTMSRPFTVEVVYADGTPERKLSWIDGDRHIVVIDAPGMVKGIRVSVFSDEKAVVA